MKTHRFAPILASLLIALCSTHLPAQEPSNWSRTFTSTDGRQLVAVPLSKTDTTITVRRIDTGKEFVLSLEALSNADQAFVKAWTPPPIVAPVAAVRPPADASGPVAGTLVIVPIGEGGAINPLGAGMFENEPLKDGLFIDVSAFGHHVIAITADGKPICFGMDQDGRPMTDVLPRTNRKMMTCIAGEFTDYLIDENGRIETMRAPGFIPERQRLKRIFRSAYFGLDQEDRLKFIGPEHEKTTYALPTELEDLAVKDVHSGEHVVAVTEDGRLFLWGKTGRGQLPLPPELADPDAQVAVATVNGSATIAVRTDGQIVIWGEDRRWWGSQVTSAPGAVASWSLWDGYWSAKIFRQVTEEGVSYTVYSTSPERDEYLQKMFDQHKPIKITQTKDAIIMLTAP